MIDSDRFAGAWFIFCGFLVAYLFSILIETYIFIPVMIFAWLIIFTILAVMWSENDRGPIGVWKYLFTGK